MGSGLHRVLVTEAEEGTSRHAFGATVEQAFGEVLGEAGIPFGPKDPVASLSAKLAWAKDHPEECAAAGQTARLRAEHFRWENVLARYDQIFRGIRTTAPR